MDDEFVPTPSPTTAGEAKTHNPTKGDRSPTASSAPTTFTPTTLTPTTLTKTFHPTPASCSSTFSPTTFSPTTTSPLLWSPTLEPSLVTFEPTVPSFTVSPTVAQTVENSGQNQTVDGILDDIVGSFSTGKVLLVGTSKVAALLVVLAAVYYIREALKIIWSEDAVEAFESSYLKKGEYSDVEAGELINDRAPLLKKVDSRPVHNSNSSGLSSSSGLQSNIKNYSNVNTVTTPVKFPMGLSRPAPTTGTTVEQKFAGDDCNSLVVSDRELFTKFTKILSNGIVISLHTMKGPRPVRFSLQDEEVRWETAVKKEPSTSGGKRYKLKLVDIVYVESGQETSNFRRQREARREVNAELCFSLVTEKTTLDLEATSSTDRDALVRGFKLAVSRAKARARVL